MGPCIVKWMFKVFTSKTSNRRNFKFSYIITFLEAASQLRKLARWLGLCQICRIIGWNVMAYILLHVGEYYQYIPSKYHIGAVSNEKYCGPLKCIVKSSLDWYSLIEQSLLQWYTLLEHSQVKYFRTLGVLQKCC